MTKLGKIKHHINNRYLIYCLKKSKVLGCTRYALGTNHQLFSPLNVEHGKCAIKISENVEQPIFSHKFFALL